MDWIACWLLTCLQMKILLMVGQDKLKAGLGSCPPDLVVAIETSRVFLYFYITIDLPILSLDAALFLSYTHTHTHTHQQPLNAHLMTGYIVFFFSLSLSVLSTVLFHIFFRHSFRPELCQPADEISIIEASATACT